MKHSSLSLDTGLSFTRTFVSTMSYAHIFSMCFETCDLVVFNVASQPCVAPVRPIFSFLVWVLSFVAGSSCACPWCATYRTTPKTRNSSQGLLQSTNKALVAPLSEGRWPLCKPAGDIAIAFRGWRFDRAQGRQRERFQGWRHGRLCFRCYD